jgi:hypothetical protein
MHVIIPILKNVPLASIERKQARRKYPFEQMEVGDMIFVPGTTKISTYVSAAGSKLGWRFRTRRLHMHKKGTRWKPCTKDAEDAIFGTGVWRTA